MKDGESEQPASRSRSASRPWRRRTAKVAIFVGALLLALLIAEGAVRALHLAPGVRPLVISGADSVYRRSDNPILGYEHKANYRNPDPDSVFSCERTNAHGQRDVERTIAKPLGARRIILLGDSVVEGLEVRNIDRLMSRQLEALYPDGKTEVLNFGVNGYCTLAEVELLRVKGLRFSPDVVVVVFVENDFNDFNFSEAFHVAPRRPRIVNSLFLNSHLFRIVCLRLNLFHFRVDVDPVRWNRRAIGNNSVARSLKTLRRLVDRHGFDVLVAVWPQFADSAIHDSPFMPGDPDRLIVEALAGANGIPVVRLSKYFRAHVRSMGRPVSPREYFTVADGMHANQRAHQVAAAALKDALDRLPAVAAEARRTTPVRKVAVRAASEAARKINDRPWSYARAYANTGHMLAAQGDWDRARCFYDAALERDPDCYQALLGMGNLLARHRRLDEAVEWLQRAEAVKSDDPVLHDDLGEAQAARGQISEAIKHYRQSLRLKGGQAEVHSKLGAVLAKAGRVTEAVSHLEEALRLRPDLAAAHNGLGVLLAARGLLNEAQTHYEAALRGRPGSPETHKNLGGILSRKGQTEKAVEHLKEALRLRPEYAEAHNDLGVVLAGQGCLDAAVKEFRAALSLRPDYAGAKRNLAAVLRRLARRRPTP